MLNAMVAALADRVTVYERDGVRELIEEDESLADSLTVLEAVEQLLRTGAPAGDPVLRALALVRQFHNHRVSVNGLDTVGADLALTSLLGICLAEHPNPELSRLATRGCGDWLTADAALLERRPPLERLAYLALRIVALRTTDPGLIRSVHVTTGRLLFEMHRRTEEVERLEGAVQCLRAAVAPGETAVDPGPDWYYHDLLGTAAYFLYRATHDMALLAESVGAHWQALEGEPPRERRPAVLDNLGASLYEFARTHRDTETLWHAFDCFVQAAESGSVRRGRPPAGTGRQPPRSGEREEPGWQAEPDGQTEPGVWKGAADLSPLDKAWAILRTAPSVCETPGQLAEAVERGFALLARYGERSAAHAHRMSFQCELLFAFLILVPDRAGLDRHVRLARRVHDAFPPGSPEHLRAGNDLGVAHALRYEHVGDPADAAEARALFDAAGSLPDAVVALRNLRGLSAMLSAGSAERTTDPVLHDLHEAGRLADGYFRRDNPMFLAEAVRRAERALRAGGRAHPARPELCLLLSQLREHQARDGGDAGKLEQAFDLARTGAALAPAGTPLRARLDSRLSQLLRTRYEENGDLTDLHEAVRLAESAVRDAPDDLERAVALNRLGLALDRRHEHNHDVADLENALVVRRRAVELVHGNDEMRATMLGNLGSAHSARYHRFGQRADLEQAIVHGRACVRLTDAKHLNAATRWANLAGSLRQLARLDGDPAHLTEALTYAEAAVGATPLGHTERGRRLTTLSGLLLGRCVTTGRLTDLARAVAQARAAVRASAPLQAHRAEYLSHLGEVLLTAAVLRPESYAVEEALAAFDEARHHAPSLVHFRGIAAQKWAETRARSGDLVQAVEGAALALDLLERVDWHGMSLADRADVTLRWEGFARDAAAWSLSLGEPGRALETLERGRGLLWAQLSGLGGELARLERAHPARAAAFRALRDKARELTGEGTGPGPVRRRAADGPTAGTPAARTAPAPAVAARTARGEQLADVNSAYRREVAAIRALPGFGTFLGPPSADRLGAAIGTGSVAVLNVSGSRCDALLVRADGTRTLPLAVPGTKVTEQVERWTTVRETAETARRALHAAALAGRPAPVRERLAYRTALDEQEELLAWGWEALTGPVLAALGHTTVSTGDASAWPRVWWCPTGPLTAFPLAATGHHDGSGRAVADRVVSSETPALRALAEAAERIEAPAAPRLLAVAVPTPYDRDDALPGVPAEHAAVLSATPIAVTPLDGPRATRTALLDALPGHSRLHFAGHGTGGTPEPSDAALSAYDAPLRMADLVGLPLDGAELAYLSACHGGTGSAAHPDESLHLAAALHVVGFRHVIAARQRLDDRLAAETAAAFHRRLAHVSDPAVALHETLREIRARECAEANGEPPGDPWWWTGFVHVGPGGAGPGDTGQGEAGPVGDGSHPR